MATITVQTATPFAGLNHAYAAVATGDKFTNDGATLLLFKNANASSRTLTLAGNATDVPGFGTISSADLSETITIPGSGTNNGECLVGFLPINRFNDSNGQVTLNLDASAGLTAAAVKMARPA